MGSLRILSKCLHGSSPELMGPKEWAVQVLDLNSGTVAFSSASTLRPCLTASLEGVWSFQVLSLKFLAQLLSQGEWLCRLVLSSTFLQDTRHAIGKAGAQTMLVGLS